MSGGAVLALDQGTTGSAALVVSADGEVLGRAYSEFAQHFPRPGWVEHDAEEIWRVTARVAREAVSAAGVAVVGVGVANQRETVAVWDPETLEPLRTAIVWQDRRTAGLCGTLKEAGHEEMVRQRTGLLLDPYFSGTKLRWIFEDDPDLARRARSGALAAGTIDSWLIARLTGGAVHATDPTNASRTLLYDLDEGGWNDELLDLMGVPRRILPQVRPSSGDFGVTDGDVLGVEVPIGGVAGDQQAALYGQGCWEAGTGKCTYGTGAFLLFNTGAERVSSGHGLLTTAACDARGGPAFALEGSIFVAGAAIQWLRDGLGILEHAAHSEEMARSLDGNDDVYLVPAFVGLGAPHWRPDARGTITGLTRGTTRAHLVRAALEAMAYGTREVVDAMERDAGLRAAGLRVDGGAAKNDWLLGFIAGILGVPVTRPELVETTALGAAGLAGLHAGVWGGPEDFAAAMASGRTFEARLAPEEREKLIAGWEAAVGGALAVGELTSRRSQVLTLIN
ncbi:MAG: glycerol kinase GlpK [Gemmatimonadota bacterium]|nr:glycerol kinase GlpK [Gemmatimonadota bacterium]